MRKLKTSSDIQIIEIHCTRSAAEESLLPLLADIKRRGDPGHSFEIIMDKDSEEGPGNFGWDGDGSDFIKKIIFDGKQFKP